MKQGKRLLISVVIMIMTFLSGCINIHSADKKSTDKESDMAILVDTISNEKRQIKSEKCFNANGKMEIFREYDEKGNMTAQYVYNKDNSIDWDCSYIREYDEMGNMITEDRHYEKSIRKYDSEGRLTACNYYSKDYISENTYEYDKNGNQISYYYYKKINNVEMWNGYYETYEYNEDGNLTTQYRYEPDGTRHVDIRRIYDDSGNMVAEYSYDNRGAVIWKASNTYEYDYNNNRRAQYSYNENGVKYLEYTWRYDNSGNMLEQILYNMDGTIDWKSSNAYEYNTGNNLTTEYTFDEDGFKWEQKSFEYDGIGNMVRESTYASKDRLSKVREYNADGKVMEERNYNQDGILGREVFEYDANGNTVSLCVYNQDGTIDYQHRYEYNEEGDMVMRYGYNED